ncbi:MAG: GDSL-type esterase/lipase family protein [Bacteroides fragilis]|nr:GDSL-type esterase/lipase family protein [Bacteroides fragilis]
MVRNVRNEKSVIRKRKSVLAWALVFALSVLAGCGSRSGNDGNAADAESPADTAAAADAAAPDAEKSAGGNGLAGAETPAGADSADAEAEAEEGAGEKEMAASETAARKVSILGDSISTFDGWIPEGYACFFPMDGEVPDVEQTWWKMALKDMEMELCVNGSSSGSTCTGDSSSAYDFQSGCSECRVGSLIGSNGAFPDVIIVYMGTNDFLKAVPIGDNDGTRAVEEGVIETFSDAYCMILDKLTAYYPGAEIYCCNLPPIGDWGPENGSAFVTFVNGQELSSADYGKQIEIIAAAKGCKVIDLQNCGITIENMENYVTDGVHMNPKGMELVRDAVEAAL